MIPQDSQEPQAAKPGPSPLLVWQWPEQTHEAAVAGLRRLADNNGIPLVLHERMGTAAEALQASPGALLLLVVPCPYRELAAGMATGQAPSSLLDDWMSRTRDVLNLRRTDRRRSLMITPDAAMLCPAALCARLGVKALPDAAAPALPDNDPVLELLARHAIDAHAEARSIAHEINASLLRADQTADGPALDVALRHYHQAREVQELTEQLLVAQKEAETQYRRAEELASLRTERDAALAETEFFLTQLTLVQEACDQAEARLGAMNAEHAAVVADKNAKLHKLSERKKKSEAQRDDLRRQVKDGETQRDALRRQVEQLVQQKHQLTQGLESHQVLLQETETARHALREQLAQMHDVHAELEGHFARAETLEDSLADREAALAEAQSNATRFKRQSLRLEDRIATLDQSLAAYQAQIAERESRIAALDTRLNRILRSPGYRMTAPLRALFGRSSRDA